MSSEIKKFVAGLDKAVSDEEANGKLFCLPALDFCCTFLFVYIGLYLILILICNTFEKV